MESKDFLSIEHCFSPLDFSGETSKPEFDYEELKKKQKEYEESAKTVFVLGKRNVPAPKKPTDKKKEEEEREGRVKKRRGTNAS